MARVFVSSRFEEFATLRKALSREVANAPGVEIVNLDDGKAALVGPVERSITTLKECDVVVLLCGKTYADWDEPGYVAGTEPGRLSTTHLEYRAAIEAKTDVLVYRTAADCRDPRLEAMLAEVDKPRVIGTLVEDDFDNADRILDQLEDWASREDEAADPDVALSFAGQLMRDLEYLGVKGLDAWALPDLIALREPAYVRLIEQRRFALKSLSAGEVDAARGQLNDAHSIYSLDWATDYILARLLEVKNIKQDQSTARGLARKANLAVADQNHAPLTTDKPQDALKRRMVATLTLQARLERRAGNPQTGVSFAEQALDLAPTSREALVERVKLCGLAGEVEKAKDAALNLLKIYPDRAVTLMRSEDLASVQPAVEHSLIDFVLERHDSALKALRVQVPPMTRPTRLRVALNLLRGANDVARSGLAEATIAVRELTEVVSEDGKEDWVTPSVERRPAELETLGRVNAEMLGQIESTNEAIAELSAASDFSDWSRLSVSFPQWAVEGLDHLRGKRVAQASNADEASALFVELGRKGIRPRRPGAWALKQQAKAVKAEGAGQRKLRAFYYKSGHRVWWGLIIVASFLIFWYGMSLHLMATRDGDYRPLSLGENVENGVGSFAYIVAGLAFIVAVFLFLFDPLFDTRPRKFARRRRSNDVLAARIQTAARLKVCLQAGEILGAQEAALVAELGSRHQELLEQLVWYRDKLSDKLEGASPLASEYKEGITKAGEVHLRSTMILGLDPVVDFGGVVADLVQRYARYNKAFAVFPNLMSRAYVPLRRALPGDLTRIEQGDATRGGFLHLALDVSRRLVRVSHPGQMSDVGAILGDVSVATIAFELCLSRYVVGPVAAAGLASVPEA